MNIGVVYPQRELPTYPGTVRRFAQSVEALGYQHILTSDHVLGTDPTLHPGWSGPYDVDSTFHEPLVFYGYLAAITRLELATCVIIAPQRETALLAKQAAEVDILADGRFRLGLGVGWNAVEYEALGQDFTTRGQREEEQIGLLRRLWSERTVTHEGRFDRVIGAGLAPPPVQRPIPIWLGAQSPAAYSRVGRLADGWFSQVPPGPELDDARAIIAAAAAAAGRDPLTLGMEGRIRIGRVSSTRVSGHTFVPRIATDPARDLGSSTDDLVRHVELWRDAGATHVSLNTMRSGFSGIEAHLDALALAAGVLQITQ